jgi:hypothetical protein
MLSEEAKVMNPKQLQFVLGFPTILVNDLIDKLEPIDKQSIKEEFTFLNEVPKFMPSVTDTDEPKRANCLIDNDEPTSVYFKHERLVPNLLVDRILIDEPKFI